MIKLASIPVRKAPIWSDNPIIPAGITVSDFSACFSVKPLSIAFRIFFQNSALFFKSEDVSAKLIPAFSRADGFPEQAPRISSCDKWCSEHRRDHLYRMHPGMQQEQSVNFRRLLSHWFFRIHRLRLSEYTAHQIPLRYGLLLIHFVYLRHRKSEEAFVIYWMHPGWCWTPSCNRYSYTTAHHNTSDATEQYFPSENLGNPEWNFLCRKNILPLHDHEEWDHSLFLLQ